MSVLVLGSSLLAAALAEAGDEDVFFVDHSASELARLEREQPDARVFYLIGDAEVLPLPDTFVDRTVGGVGSEVDRVLKS